MTGSVSLRGLTRRFGPLTAVDTLFFDVAPGELFGLVGPDGAGKTTVLRMLAGVLPPSEGDATVDGVSVSRDPEAVKAGIAYMPQRFGLYEDLTVRENLDFYADLHRVPRRERAERLERLYAFSHLGGFADRLAGNLSGGMKQKLALSCALIHRPRILLLDEPTFGVDPISRRDLWLILHRMVAEGVTVVVSTSYMDEAERCDRVALLHRGRIVALDAPAALQRALPGRLLAFTVSRPREARDRLRTRVDVDDAALFGRRVHASVPATTAPETLRRDLEGAGFTVEGVEEVDPGLEDVFLRLTAEDGPAAAGPGPAAAGPDPADRAAGPAPGGAP